MNIIAIDLGKFNSMVCFYETTTQEHSFAKATTEKGYFRSVFENHACRPCRGRSLRPQRLGQRPL